MVGHQEAPLTVIYWFQEWIAGWLAMHPVPAAFALSVALGAMIGMERQWRQRLAGVRTNALVCLGATSFTVFAALLPNPGVDSMARVAAQVVSGIGFLGAGVIMREGLTVRGLTTAATLWCSAAVGVLCGAQMFDIAALSAAGIVSVNLTFRPISKAIDARTGRSDSPSSVTIKISFSSSQKSDALATLDRFFLENDIFWSSFSVSSNTKEGASLSGVAVCPSKAVFHKLVTLLSDHPVGFSSVSVDFSR